MPDFLEILSPVISTIGICVLAYGVALSVVRLVRIESRALRGINVRTLRSELRQSLGYYLGLGLEFLIASDVIESVFKPSLEELTHLGVIVVIRTVISISLNWELSQERRHALEETAELAEDAGSTPDTP